MRTLVAMATYSFNRLIMGKVEIGNFYCLIGDNRILFPFREHPHMFYTPSFTILYSRKGEMRGTQNEGLFSGPD